MDSALLGGGRNLPWSSTMVNQEARMLVDKANFLASQYLRDGVIRIKFMQEIKAFVDQQFAKASRAESDEECMLCVRDIRKELASLKEQEYMLRTRTAKLYAKVEFVREHNRIVGYVISAVHVVMSGVEAVGGAMMIATMTPIGMLAGAVLVADGINGVSKEYSHFSDRDTKSEGFFADEAMEAAQFMGFKPNYGLVAYDSVTLAASAYGILGLARRPGARRLFRWIPSDFYRRVDTMSRPKLTMKIVGYGLKAKVIFDLLSVSEQQSR
jgi:hypothetical protein